MKKIDLGQTIQILANVGVIAGIIFLAIELRQNNRQLALQSYQDWVATNMQINTAVMIPEVAAIANAGNIDATNLTDDTFITHAMIQLAMFQMAQSTDYLYRQGALDEGLWRAEMSRAWESCRYQAFANGGMREVGRKSRRASQTSLNPLKPISRFGAGTRN